MRDTRQTFELKRNVGSTSTRHLLMTSFPSAWLQSTLQCLTAGESDMCVQNGIVGVVGGFPFLLNRLKCKWSEPSWAQGCSSMFQSRTLMCPFPLVCPGPQKPAASALIKTTSNSSGRLLALQFLLCPHGVPLSCFFFFWIDRWSSSVVLALYIFILCVLNAVRTNVYIWFLKSHMLDFSLFLFSRLKGY